MAPLLASPTVWIAATNSGLRIYRSTSQWNCNAGARFGVDPDLEFWAVERVADFFRETYQTQLQLTRAKA